jgi:putative restriction endonuclease
MNWVKLNRKQLEQTNYVLKADISSKYWFGVSQNKIIEYRSRFNSNFNIILFGSEISETDFYILPYEAIEDLLIEDNLYLSQGRIRWVGDIQNHILKIRNSKKERSVSNYFSLPLTDSTFALVDENLNDYAIENAKREVQVRIRQSVFRQKVLNNFQYKCCLTGISENELLVASHIIPWAVKLDTRISPHNGLCLSVLYDSLFDKGFFTLSDQFEVIITSEWGRLSPHVKKWLSEISGRIISPPIKFEISKDALSYHRNNVFDRF